MNSISSNVSNIDILASGIFVKRCPFFYLVAESLVSLDTLFVCVCHLSPPKCLDSVVSVITLKEIFEQIAIAMLPRMQLHYHTPHSYKSTTATLELVGL